MKEKLIEKLDRYFYVEYNPTTDILIIRQSISVRNLIYIKQIMKKSGVTFKDFKVGKLV